MKKISTDKAPAAIGPYSQAIKADKFLFASGQSPINPATGVVEAQGIEDQTRQVMKNIGAVLEAAGTKWNFLKFVPGLVGGHCIGVYPYYLTYKAEQLGYHSQIILAGRRINDDMGKYVAENVVKKLIAADIPVKGAKIAILGFTFKENCPDTRNTKIIDIYRELQEYGITPVVADPAADAAEAKRLYGIEFVDLADVKDMDAVILAVAHDQFKSMSVADFDRFYTGEKTKVLIDVKAMLNKPAFEFAGYIYWRL